MRHAPGGPRNRLLDGVVTGREKLRAIHRSLVEVVPKPVFAGLVALRDRMARVPSMLATVLVGRRIAAANVAAGRAAPEVEPPRAVV